MSTRSLRNRSSRFSSPATIVEREAASRGAEAPAGKNGQQTTLDKWVEPPVRAPVPSFEDSKGLERVGVLELIQPLGVPPSQKLLQKLKLNYARPSPRGTPTQNEEVVTAVVAEAEKLDHLVSPVESEMAAEHPPPPVPPPPPPSFEPVVISSPPRGRPAKKDIAEMSLINLTPSPVKSTFSSATPVSPKPHSIQEHLRQDRLRNHVDHAVRIAEQKGEADLVPGLRKLRHDAPLNAELWNVLEAVVQQTPSDAQFKVFKRYIKSGIKQHNKASQTPTSPFRSSAAFHETSSPHPPRALSKPVPVLSPSSSAPASTHAPTFTSPFRIKPPTPGHHEAPSREAMPVSPSTVTVKMTPVDGGAESPLRSSSSPTRKRSRSVSSSSSLSSAQSMPEEFGPALQAESQMERSFRPTGQRQAANRGPAGNKLRSAATNNHPTRHALSDFSTTIKFASKRFKKSRDEPELDAAELSRRKREYAADSFYDYNNFDHPESSERLPVHGNPDQPADSRLHPRPPVVHPHQLNPSQVALSSPASTQAAPELHLPNGTGRKRNHDELEQDDIDVITPQSSSPGPSFAAPPPGVAAAAAVSSTRSATPRAARLPPPHKIRKSARVMVS